MSKISKKEKIEKAMREMEVLSDRGKKIKKKKKDLEKNLQPLIKDFPNDVLGESIRPVSDFSSKIKSSDRQKQRLEMVRYLFVKYPVPKILEQSWYNESKVEKRLGKENVSEIKILVNEYNYWYICAGTGRSLHKEYLKEFMTKKETNAFINCSKPLSINGGIYYATALCAGANDGIAYRIAKSKLGRKPKNNIFWRDCARFFAKNTPDSINQIDDIVDFLEHKKRENINFNIFGQGYTLKSLLERVKDWHYELRRIKEHSGYSWKGADISDGEYIRKNDKGENIIWTMKQILTGKELAEEGNKMHHCVYSYRDRCIKGYSSIWSLKMKDSLNEKRAGTIEVSSGRIVQARGFANQSLKSNEKNILSIWARENNISF